MIKYIGETYDDVCALDTFVDDAGRKLYGSDYGETELHIFSCDGREYICTAEDWKDVLKKHCFARAYADGFKFDDRLVTWEELQEDIDQNYGDYFVNPCVVIDRELNEEDNTPPFEKELTKDEQYIKEYLSCPIGDCIREDIEAMCDIGLSKQQLDAIVVHFHKNYDWNYGIPDQLEDAINAVLKGGE